MQKKFLVIGLISVAFAVQAQTFQRKAQQPAFFIPQSAISTQKQEKLPAVENMNYHGRRAPSTIPIAKTTQPAQKINENPFRQPKVETSQMSAGKNQTIETDEIDKKAEKIVTNEQNKTNFSESVQPKISAETQQPEPQSSKTASKNDNPDDYQSVFAEIMLQHKTDLSNISKGKTVENPNIANVMEAFKSKVHTISDTITY